MVKLEGARYFVFLQPTMGLMGEQSRTVQGTPDNLLFQKLEEDYLVALNEFYKKARDKCLTLDFCFDISHIGPPTGDVYHDPRHHNEKGNALIAAEIMHHIIDQ